MLQQAMKRLMPAGLLQGQAAIATKLGLETPLIKQQQQQREQHAGGASIGAQTPFHVPSLLSNLLGSDAQRREDQQASAQSAATMQPMGNKVLELAGAFGRKPSAFAAPTIPMGLAGSCLAKPTMPLLSAMSSSPLMMMMAKQSISPLGLSQRPLSIANSRAYGTEGELVGSAFLLTTDIMFWSGMLGAVIFRRNLIVMLLCTEIVMLACNMNFLFASAYLNDMTGVIMSITITTIAACETAIGLALCVTYFHLRSATDVEALNLLK